MFNRDFLSVAGINFLILVPYYMLFVISAPYAVERFGASASTGGLVAGVMALGVLTGRFFSGRFIGSAGSQKVLIFGLVEFIAVMALYLAVDSLPLLVAVRFLSGIGIGCIGTVTGTLIAHVTPQGQLGAGISYFSLSTILGMAAGPFLGVFLLARVSFSFIFLFCCAAGVVCLVFSLFLTTSIPAAGNAAGVGPLSFRLGEYLERRALPVSLVVLVVAQGYGCLQAFIAFHAESIGLTGAAGAFFSVYAAVILISRPVTGKLMDRHGENLVIYPSLVLLICGLALLGYANSSWTFLLSAGLIGAGFGNFQSTCQVVSVKAATRDRIPQATSTFFIFLELGISFGPYLFGIIVPHAGYHGLFHALAAVTLASIPLYYFLHGRKAAAPTDAA